VTKTDALLEFVKSVTGAAKVDIGKQIQQLWSGYGHITRLHLTSAAVPSIIVKVVNPPDQSDHPRGWNTDASHQRKLRSYKIETCCYNDWIDKCNEAARVATCYGCKTIEGSQVIVMEDLDSVFPHSLSTATLSDAAACLQWLAKFHARFMGTDPVGLWPTGTYWHLATRQDEWQVMKNTDLKEAAEALDKKLSGGKFQSIVHGDAKIANFCFAAGSGDSSERVAAVDFQYVGGGCGMKDVAYFLGSCLSESDCARHDDVLLDGYFAALGSALEIYQPAIESAAVIDEWRNLYAIAWTDFYRFLNGWMPDHPKVHSYTKQLAQQALRQL